MGHFCVYYGCMLRIADFDISIVLHASMNNVRIADNWHTSKKADLIKNRCSNHHITSMAIVALSKLMVQQVDHFRMVIVFITLEEYRCWSRIEQTTEYNIGV